MDPQDKYKAEQTALRNRYDGTGGEEPTVIVVPEAPEVRPEVYRDVESILFRGFITTTAVINKVVVVFKNVNQHELDLLKFSVSSLQEGSAAFWDLFLAHSIFMLDGINLLPDRSRWLSELKSLFQDIPGEARSNIIRHVSEINRRASRAVHMVEAYAMENVSRYRWLQTKGLSLTAVDVTGIDGTQKLGLNWGQLTWRAINQVEDSKEEQERDWENAKFVGSCFAGKGVQKIYNQDNDRRSKDKADRIARKDKILREHLLGEVMDERAQNELGIIKTIPRTVKELVAQMTADLKGEKDWHDQVVEAHMQQVQAQNDARRKQLEDIQRAGIERGEGFLYGGTSYEKLTPDQVREKFSRSKQLAAQELARRQVLLPELDEKTSKFMSKWGLAGKPDEQLSTTDRDTTEAISVPPPKTPTKPFRR